MRLLKPLLSFVALLFFFSSTPLYASEQSDTPDTLTTGDFLPGSLRLFSSALEGFFVDEKPDWLKRIHSGFSFQEDLEPIIYVEMVQPLYQTQDKSDTFFIQ